MMTKEDLDKIAKEYHTAVINDKFIEDANQVYSLGWITEQIKDSNSILELGYGEGIITDNLAKSGKRVTVVEGSSLLTSKIKEKYGEKVNCVHSLFEEFTPDGSFDAIIAGHVLEHVDDPVDLLIKMKSWLTSKGKIIIIVPNKESIHRRLAVLMGLQPMLDTLSARDKLVGHQRVYSLRTLMDDLYKCQLKVLVARGLGYKPLPNSMMLDFKPELIRAMNDISESMPIEMASNLSVVATAM